MRTLRGHARAAGHRTNPVGFTRLRDPCGAAKVVATSRHVDWVAQSSHEMLHNRANVLRVVVQMEELKLLSTAERLGLLSLAEKALTADPGAISSASILPLIAGVGKIQSRLCPIPCLLKPKNIRSSLVSITPSCQTVVYCSHWPWFSLQ